MHTLMDMFYLSFSEHLDILNFWWPFFIVKNASNNQSNDIIMTRQIILPDKYLTKIKNVPQESPA